MTNYQRCLLLILVVVVALSWIQPLYPSEMVLQHIPTVLFFVGMIWLGRKYPLSNTAATCLFLFMLLHVLGARYIYSNVPYDRWLRSIAGLSLSEKFGWQRNHFDRLVHFCFGLLWVRPVWEICVNYVGVPRRFAYYTAFEFVLAFSMVYELIEWALALFMAPHAADAYNGQQGDMWDAQKDMSLALVGALIAVGAWAVVERWCKPREGATMSRAEG